MKLKPNTGIDNLIFGMKRAAIQRLMGRPDAILTDEDDPNQLIWVFNKKKMMLTFYKHENYKLAYLRTAHPQVMYNGMKIIGMNIKQAQTTLEDNREITWKIEDYGIFSIHTDYENWTILNVSYGVVTDIEIGLPFDKHNRYIWPPANKHKASKRFA